LIAYGETNALALRKSGLGPCIALRLCGDAVVSL
jgi:hypothetical protein